MLLKTVYPYFFRCGESAFICWPLESLYISCSIFRWKGMQEKLNLKLYYKCGTSTAHTSQEVSARTQLLIYQMGQAAEVDYRQWLKDWAQCNKMSSHDARVWDMGMTLFSLIRKYEKKMPPNCSSTLYLFYLMIFKFFLLAILHKHVVSWVLDRDETRAPCSKAQVCFLGWPGESALLSDFVGVSVCGVLCPSMSVHTPHTSFSKMKVDENIIFLRTTGSTPL